MARTKGAKDLKPRKMNPDAMFRGIPGYHSASLRVYGPEADVRWFERMDSKERGVVIAAARRAME